MASVAFPTKTISMARVAPVMDLCSQTNSISSIRMDKFHSFREMISLKIVEQLTNRWNTQTMQHLASLSSTLYMLRKT